jgi:hypothetical protein
MEQRQKIFIGVLGLVVIVLIFVAVFSEDKSDEPGKYDQFAQCLTEKGATFYGAFWCPHCNDQKKLFGSSRGLLPYVECSTPDGNGTTQICKDKNISGYPTWEFADGSRPFSGKATLEQLAEQTGCLLPSEESEIQAIEEVQTELDITPEIEILDIEQ